MEKVKVIITDINFLLIILSTLTLLLLAFYVTQAFAVSNSGEVQVNITVKPYTKLLMEKNLVQIEPRREDIDKGYVEVRGGSEMKLFTNVPQGASLTARVTGKMISSRGREIPLSRLMFRLEGESDYRPFTEEEVLIYKSSGMEPGTVKRVDYRLNLGWDTEADTYKVMITYTYNINE